VKWRVSIVAALGVALALYLVLFAGIGAVFSAAVAVGWSGFGILCLYALGLFLVLGLAWYVLLPDRSVADPRVFVWARMVRDAATEVLPFSQLGGIVLGARAAILKGVSPPFAFASTIVDVTTELWKVSGRSRIPLRSKDHPRETSGPRPRMPRAAAAIDIPARAPPCHSRRT
jgi:hypothetical protein